MPRKDSRYCAPTTGLGTSPARNARTRSSVWFVNVSGAAYSGEFVAGSLPSSV